MTASAPSEPVGRVVKAVVAGQDVAFFVADEADHIQSHHAAGRFYELEELVMIGRNLRRGATFVDIGANVGNHLVFVALFRRPARILAFEPNPRAAAILRRNVELNGLDGIVDLSQLGIGLSDRSGRATIAAPDTNLGAARLTVDGAGGTIPVETGDALLDETRIDFIKIDAEGMELAVLAGLAGVLKRWRPTLFVEVEDTNRAAFEAWLSGSDYEVAETYRRYVVNENLLLRPKRAGPRPSWRERVRRILKTVPERTGASGPS